MTTVKEFKDFGVIPVIGDKYTFKDTGGVESFEMIVGEGEEFDGEFCTDRGIYDDNQLHNLNPLSFAWRPFNTLPDNPKFKYEKSEFDSFWRPLLDQSKKSAYDVGAHVSGDKPVFTQEIVKPSVGFKFKFNHDIDGKFSRLYSEKYSWEDGDTLEIICITENHDGDTCYIVLNCQPDVLTTAAITDLSFFDTRTPKQKAVDAMLEDAEVQGSKGAFERLYDKGYRKC